MKIHCDDGGVRKRAGERETDSEGEGETRKRIERAEREKKGECICPAGSKHKKMGVEAKH